MTFIRAEIKSYLEKLRFKMDGQKLLTLTILRIWTVLARGHCALSFRYKNDSEDFFFNKFKTIPVQVQLRSLPIYEFILL